MTARSVTGKIESDIGKPEFLARDHNRVASVKGAHHLLLCDFDAGHCRVSCSCSSCKCVPAHPRLSDPERVDLLLEGSNLAKSFACDARAIRKAARKASGGGFVPDRKAKLFGKAANVRFGDTGLDQWAACACLLGRFETGAVVAEVVDVGAIDRECQSPFALLLLADAIELALAMKATIDIVLGVVLVIDFV